MTIVRGARCDSCWRGALGLVLLATASDLAEDHAADEVDG